MPWIFKGVWTFPMPMSTLEQYYIWYRNSNYNIVLWWIKQGLEKSQDSPTTKKYIASSKVVKLSVIYWKCVSSKIKCDYEGIKNELSRNGTKFKFADPCGSSKLKYYLYRNNDLKHNSFLSKPNLTWKPVQSPEFSPIENL